MGLELVLYSGKSCGLCAEMRVQLEPLLRTQQASLRVVDIAGDPELMNRFAERIPVLLCQGEILCEGRLDADRVEQRLRLPADLDI